jgi:hypothetical protein
MTSSFFKEPVCRHRVHKSSPVEAVSKGGDIRSVRIGGVEFKRQQEITIVVTMQVFKWEFSRKILYFSYSLISLWVAGRRRHYVIAIYRNLNFSERKS